MGTFGFVYVLLGTFGYFCVLGASWGVLGALLGRVWVILAASLGRPGLEYPRLWLDLAKFDWNGWK